MNKKILIAGVIALAVLASSMAIISEVDDGSVSAEITNTDVASIGDVGYPTLESAVKAASSGATIELLKDTSGSGIGLFNTETGNGKILAKSLTIDFGGHTYTVCESPVGSGSETEYQTQAFHLESNCENFTLKNGTITSQSGSGVMMLVQNYCNLTLDNVILDGSNIGNGQYVLSNNCGVVSITGTTSITAPTDGFAFDACSTNQEVYSAGTQVTVDTTGTITGKVEFGVWGTVPDSVNTSLTINNGIFIGDLIVDSRLSDAAETKIIINGGSFTDLVDAVRYAASGKTIKLADDVTCASTISLNGGKTITIDLNGHTISAASRVFDVQNCNLTLTGNGTIQETQNDGYAPLCLKGSNNSADTNYTVITVGEGVTLKGWSGLMISPYESGSQKVAYGVVVNIFGDIVSPAQESHTAYGSGVYVNGQIQHKENCPVITLNSTVSINAKLGIYAAGYADWNIEGASITGYDSGIAVKAGKFIINDATISCTGPDASPTTGYSNGVNEIGRAHV